jgi:hypothetical protein
MIRILLTFASLACSYCYCLENWRIGCLYTLVIAALVVPAVMGWVESGQDSE